MMGFMAGGIFIRDLITPKLPAGLAVMLLSTLVSHALVTAILLRGIAREFSKKILLPCSP
jgi:hypothetical protein